MKQFYLFLILILILIATLPAQNVWKEASELYDDYGHEYSNTDSCFYYGGYYYIAGIETLYIHLPTMRSLGQMKIWGYVTADDTLFAADYGMDADTTVHSGLDTIYFAIGPHHGNGRTMNTNITHTFTAMDTAQCNTLAVNAFEFYLPEVDALMDKPTLYETLRMIGTADNFGQIYIKVEWVIGY